MEYTTKAKYSFQEIENGALILLLLRESTNWKELCARFDYADPEQLETNTTTKALCNKLFDMRRLGLISFEADERENKSRPAGLITETPLWSKIAVAFGGMSLHEMVLLSRYSQGMAVTPVFRRPNPLKIDVFALVPFDSKMARIYTNRIKKACEELGLTIQRADDSYAAGPFMEKVWDGICAAKLILADCTEENPNVFYEIGIAHTVGKKVVLITRSDKDIPSDIKHFDYIPYTDDPGGVDVLIERLRPFVSNLRTF